MQDMNKSRDHLESQMNPSASKHSHSDEFPGLAEEMDQANNGGGSGMERRTFLKMAGFSMAGMLVSGCGYNAEEKMLPYLVAPENIVPGKAYWYASTCGACSAACGILTKNRDGRPIKMEGNALHPLSKGGLCAVGQASVLGLYDSQRLQKPTMNSQVFSWADMDSKIIAELDAIRSSSGRVRFLTGSIPSPTLRKRIQDFLARFKDGKHIQYDALSSAAILDAQEKSFGKRALPQYRFDEAEIIFSLGADFLGTWISPVEYTQAYQAGRTLTKDDKHVRLSRHIHIESGMSLTGSNADERVTLSPSEVSALIPHLALQLSKKTASPLTIKNLGACPVAKSKLHDWVDALWSKRGRSLVVSDSNDLNDQLCVNYINNTLGNYGKTLTLENSSNQVQGSDNDIVGLLAEMKAGEVDALLVYGVNPGYDLPFAEEFGAAIEKVKCTISFSERRDETSKHTVYICPDHHALESWSDAEPVAGILSITQPALRPLGGTRSVLESLSVWNGAQETALDILQKEWKATHFRQQKKYKLFQTFWDQTLHDGYVEVFAKGNQPSSFKASTLQAPAEKSKAEGAPLLLYSKVAMRDGRHGHNAWLHELPDPISKTVWDNYACLSVSYASKHNIKTGDIVALSMAGADTKKKIEIELPVLVQEGQHDAVVAVALGYGRMGTDRFEKVGPVWLEGKATVEKGGTVGVNASSLIAASGAHFMYQGSKVKIRKTKQSRSLARSQTYHSLQMPIDIVGKAEKRKMVQETTVAAYEKDPSSGGHHGHPVTSLWANDHRYKGHHWGMSIDLNACTGCSGCVISCQAENNIPVVGRDEVRRGRDLNWMRIDRYYAQEDDHVDVVHQPMMCHHCDNAPCEVVCPVLATVHSSEGINQQVYNRCVGTRYCANNCPYKVRRFNWFQYKREDQMQNMVLNPDITVRSRGVMEKCSFCYQRVQEAKAEAQRRGETVKDGDIQTACQQSCPAKAITFGDMNDPESEIYKKKNDPRHYLVLEELNVQPSVGYMTKVRHREDEEKGERHG